jgi:hypothetical protein
MEPREGWKICNIQYSEEEDAVLLKSEDGQTLAMIPRNRVIEMISVLPRNPPERKS